MKPSIYLFLFILLAYGCKHIDSIEDKSSTTVIANQDILIGQYEKSGRVFTRYYDKKLNIISYFHRRRIGEAFVEKDYIRYRFDASTNKIISKTEEWRSDLPDHIAAVITREEAENKARGEILESRLYFISQKSQVFSLDPAPENPCYIIWSKDNEESIITIVDSITGEILGYGVSPPFNGFAFYCNAQEGWKKWRDNADEWFEEKMGYTIQRKSCPCTDTVKNQIQSDDIAVFYELSHGGSDSIHNECTHCPDLTASEIANWMNSYASMPFTFIGSCNGMCSQNAGTMSNSFRKGMNSDTVSVGYCSMSISPCSTDCWQDSLDWQDSFFSYIYDGLSVGDAFNQAVLDFPDCSGCMRISGDTDLVLSGENSPLARRSLSGDMYDFGNAEFSVSPLQGVPSRRSYRAYYVRDSIRVPSARTLNMLPTEKSPYIDLIFMNNSILNCHGSLFANGKKGEILLVSETDQKCGIRIKGKLTMKKGGQIKIYE